METIHEKWTAIRPDCKLNKPENYPGEIAEIIMQGYFSGEPVDYLASKFLIQLALSSDPQIAGAATSALYGTVIEGLCNDFTLRGVESSKTILLQILKYAKRDPQGADISKILNPLCLSQNDLLAFNATIRQTRVFPKAQRDRIKRIYLLSRVTIGADVVVLSVMAQHLAELFPQAEIVFVGPSHLPEIFNGFAGARHMILNYKRYGTIIEKTMIWPSLSQLIKDDRQTIKPGEVLLLDPDSRLTQLGLLPLCATQETYFFNSRAEIPPHQHASLSSIADTWMREIFESDSTFQPTVYIAKEKINIAESFYRRLPHDINFITMNLGVGRNEKKRIPAPFEEKLLLELLSRKNTLVLLDSGSSDTSKKRVLKLLDLVKGHSYQTDFINEEELPEKDINFKHGMVGFRGSIGTISALIANSQAFFGYDSGCQHIAAALGTPVAVVFAGYPNPRFFDRWRPRSGRGPVDVSQLKSTDSLSVSQIDQLAKDIAASIFRILAKPKAK